ncbi:MAG: acylphosphatase [Bacteroidota bacterium]
MQKHVNLKITGKVQGVWFRGSTQQKARELGVKGTVRNLPDGSVFVEAEGEEEVLQQFIAWCHRGSDHARVEKVEVEAGGWQGFERFEVVR